MTDPIGATPATGTIPEPEFESLHEPLHLCPQGNLFNRDPRQPSRYGLIEPVSLVRGPDDA